MQKDIHRLIVTGQSLITFLCSFMLLMVLTGALLLYFNTVQFLTIKRQDFADYGSYVQAENILHSENRPESFIKQKIRTCIEDHKSILSNPDASIRLFFIGDSRMRQQFYSFLNVIYLLCLLAFLRILFDVQVNLIMVPSKMPFKKR